MSPSISEADILGDRPGSPARRRKSASFHHMMRPHCPPVILSSMSIQWCFLGRYIGPEDTDLTGAPAMTASSSNAGATMILLPVREH